MAIKEIKREWCPSQLAFVKEFLLHTEAELADVPRCSVGSKATVSETDNEYVKTSDGWKLLCDCDEDGGQGAGGGGAVWDAIIEWDNGTESRCDLPAYNELDRFADSTGLYDIIQPILRAGQQPKILLHCKYMRGLLDWVEGREDEYFHAFYTPTLVQQYNYEEEDDVIYIYVMSQETAGFTMRRIDVKPSGISGCGNMTIVPSAS